LNPQKIPARLLLDYWMLWFQYNVIIKSTKHCLTDLSSITLFRRKYKQSWSFLQKYKAFSHFFAPFFGHVKNNYHFCNGIWQISPFLHWFITRLPVRVAWIFMLGPTNMILAHHWTRVPVQLVARFRRTCKTISVFG